MRKNVKPTPTPNKALVKQLANTKAKLEMSERQNSLVGLAIGLGANQVNQSAFGPLADASMFPLLTVSAWTILSYMYKSHGILQTAIETPVLDAFRGGIEIESEQLGEDVEVLQEALEDDDVWGAVSSSIIWKRLFGGSGLIINTEQDPESPLDMKKMKNRQLEFYAASRWELGTMSRWDKYFQYYEKKLDASRVLTMAGKEVPYPLSLQLQGWGLSEVEKMVEDFNRYLKTTNVLYELLEEAKIDVFRMDGINELLIDEVGTDQVRRRIETVNKMKSFNKALLMDKLDEYEQKQISSFAGIADIMKENRIGIASATRIPMPKLFGISAAGFSSGEDDIENYNCMVESEVRQPARAIVRKVIQLKCAQLFGIPDAVFKLRYKPLRILGAVEEEALKTSKSNRYRGYVDMGIMERVNAAKALVKEGVVDEEFADTKGLIQDEDLPGADDNEGEDKKPGEKKNSKTCPTCSKEIQDLDKHAVHCRLGVS